MAADLNFSFGFMCPEDGSLPENFDHRENADPAEAPVVGDYVHLFNKGTGEFQYYRVTGRVWVYPELAPGVDAIEHPTVWILLTRDNAMQGLNL